MSDRILDASALLAWLNDEPGSESVAADLASGATISSVNLAEVVSKLAELGGAEQEIRAVLEPLGLEVEIFEREDAYGAGMLRPVTRDLGLSLGDRACLGLGSRLERPVVTADRGWADLKLGLEVVLIR